MSETKLNLYQKLLEIQKAIIGLGKDGSSFGYKYVTGSKALEHIKPLMNQYGIILKQEVLSITNTRQDYQVKSGAKSEILTCTTQKFTWVDCESGEKDENLFGANGQNDWEKGLGSALTYAERYFLLKFFHIATDEDDIDNPDRNTNAPVPLAPPVEQKPALPRLVIDSKEFLASVNYLKNGYTKKDGTHVDVNITDLKKQFIIGVTEEQALKVEILKA